MNDFATAIASILDRDLQKVIDEIRQYPGPEDIWRCPPGINNSAGTLALHLAGNLQHFVGAVLGGTGYIRNREREFSDRDIAPDRIVTELEAARLAVSNTLQGLDDAVVDDDYPQIFTGEKRSCKYVLIHLSSHLNYHLGQLNYHRRLTI